MSSETSQRAFSWKIAKRYLWSKRSEAFINIITIISVLGVAIGVAVLTVVMAVMTGFEQELRDKILGANSHIIVRNLSGTIKDWKEISKTIEGIKGVKSASPFSYHQALVRVGNRSSGLLVRGLLNGTAGAEELSRQLHDGSKIEELFSPPAVLSDGEEEGSSRETNLPGLVIGGELARTMGIYIGEPVSLLSPNVSSSPFGLIPKYRRFVVTGIYKGLSDYESGVAYASLPEAQKFFDMGDNVSGFEIRVADIYKAPQLAKEIVDLTNSPPQGIYAQDWTESNKPLWDALRLEKRVYFIVLLLIIVMASFSIISTLVMIVLEKRRDIAVLRTLGATTKAVGNIFRLQGATIGALGTVIGLVLGVVICLLLREYGFPLDERIFQMSKLPIKIEPVNFALVGLSAFTICCIATLYPAKRASSLEPSEVLRY